MAKQIVTKTLESGAKVSSIGTVKSVIGVVTATGSDGVVRTLQVGDKVFMNDMILTSASGAVLVEFNNGGSFDLGRDSSATLDQSVFQPTPAPSSEGAKEDVASLQAKIAAGVDPTQVTEATAAGPGAGGGGGDGEGSSFVVVDQLAPQGLVNSGFPTGPIGFALQQPTGEVLPPESEPLPAVTIGLDVTVEIVDQPPNSENPSDPSLPTIVGNNAYIPEGTDGESAFNTVTFVLRLSTPFNQDVTVTYEIRPGAGPTAAVPGTDYQGVLTGTVTIPAGTTEFPVVVNIVPDHLDEGPNTFAGAENFFIILTGATNATIDPANNTATGWIVDDDTTPVARNDVNAVGEDRWTGEGEGGLLVQATGNVITDSPGSDSDVDGDTLSVVGIPPGGVDIPGVYGILHLNPDGSYVYTLNNASDAIQSLDDGDTLQDQFTYTATDGYQNSNQATLTITITGTNDAPVAQADTNWGLEDGGEVAVSGNVLQTLAHAGAPSGTFGDVADTDADGGDTLSVVSVGGSAGNVGVAIAGLYGTLTLNGDGSYSYTVDPTKTQFLDDGETASDVFNYVASDGTTGADSTLTITIFGNNDAPVAQADTNWGLEDGGEVAVSGNVLQTLAHAGAPSGTFGDVADTDADGGDTLSVVSVGGSAGNVGVAIAGLYGTLTLNGDGSYSYTVDPTKTQFLDDGETASDVFNYVASDGTTGADSTLTITIFGNNDAPVAKADTNWALEDSSVASGNVLQTLDC